MSMEDLTPLHFEALGLLSPDWTAYADVKHISIFTPLFLAAQRRNPLRFDRIDTEWFTDLEFAGLIERHIEPHYIHGRPAGGFIFYRRLDGNHEPTP